MKLVDFTNSALVLTLPDDLMWKDEFSWSPVETSKTWGVGGALILQRSTKLTGRSIQLASPDNEMGWMYRPDLLTLYAWAADSTKKMVLSLEKATDTRTFNVVFDDGIPIEATPVKGWKDHTDDEPYTVKIKLIQVS